MALQVATLAGFRPCQSRVSQSFPPGHYSQKTAKLFGSEFASIRRRPVSGGVQRTLRVDCILQGFFNLFASSPADKVQQFSVFEINDFDRGSPVYLRRPPTPPSATPPPNGVGDLVPYTNKVYDSQLKKKLGISAGMTIVIEHEPEKGGDRFEAIFSHYLGDYGSISVQGPYLTYDDTVMGITGGTGIFAGAKGTVKCHNINGPFKLIYTYSIQGISKLPPELTRSPVPLDTQVEKTAAAVPAPVAVASTVTSS